jgi:hypothetical protein
MYATKDIVTYLGVCDYRRSMDWRMDLLITCIRHSELHFTDHWHTQTSVLSLLQSPLAVSWERLYWSILFGSRSQVLLSQPPVQNSLSTDNATNWVPGWRPFHTNLLVFSSQVDFQLTTELSHSPTSYFTSLHSTELLTTDCSSVGVLVI